MQIARGTNVAVVVNRDWANLQGVRLFLRQTQAPAREIRGVDESHIVFAKVLDADDSKGLWIDLDPERHRLLVPWVQILAVVVAEEFSPEIREAARKIGFVPEK